MFTRLCIVVSVLATTACTVDPIRLKTRFNEADSAHVLQKGDGVIYGQAFVKKPSGKVIKAAGERVMLLPGTKYTAEYVHALVYHKKVILPDVVKRFHREIETDADGWFSFEGVAPGSYILLSRVTWGEKTEVFFTKFVAAYVTLRKSQKKRVMLHRSYDWLATKR